MFCLGSNVYVNLRTAVNRHETARVGWEGEKTV